jgi:hypothetical protein
VEVQARQILKSVLDARQRGETWEAVRKQNPQVSVLAPLSDIPEGVLLRYEVGSGALDSEKGAAIATQYKFQVTLVFQSRASTELRSSVLFRVGQNKDGKSWIVLGKDI